jgi:hypothetical protein
MAGGSCDFSSAAFDPKAFVSDLLSAYGSSQNDATGMEKYLLDAEMRVHVRAEALGAEVASLREEITTELPRAARKLTQIKEEVGLLHVNIEHAMRGLSVSNREDVGGRLRGAQAGTRALPSSTASEVFNELQQLQDHRDLALKAQTMLEEASNLSSLFKTIDSMLQSDDLTRLADSLARFRKGLEIVSLGQVDSTASNKMSAASSTSSTSIQRSKVDQLEERVFELAVKALDSSLRLQNGEQCRRACVVLEQIDRSGLIAQHYCTIRSQPLVELWESYRVDGSSAPYASWVGTFYEEVARAVRGEISWCGAYLHGLMGVDRRMLVMDMLVSFFGRVEVPCKARLAGATRGGLSGIEAMEQAVGCAGRFVDTLVGMLLEDRDEHAAGRGDVGGEGGDGSIGWTGARQSGESDAKAWTARVNDLIRVVIRPYDDMLRNYPGKEGAWLNETFEGLLRDSGQGDMPAVSIFDDVYASVIGSLQRCLATTQSTALPELLEAMDGPLAAFCERVAGATAAHFSANAVPASFDLEKLMLVPRMMEKIQRVLMVELAAQIREQLEGLQVGMDAFHDLEEPFGDPSTMSGPASLNFRRVSANAELSRAISRLVSSAREGRVLLPKLRVALERAVRDLESLVVGSFVSIVGFHLRELRPSLDAAQAAGPTSPSSAYPLQYMISAGEQLMLLPQLLETSLGSLESSVGETGAVDDDFVDTWLERLATATCSAYLQELDGISSLDASQCRQLSADVEYFCKILKSLDCEVPVQLVAWAALLTVIDEEGAAALVGQLGSTPEAMAVSKKVMAIRFN